MPEILFNDPEYITVEYNEEKKYIEHTIYKPVESLELLKDALNAGTDALEKYGVCKWLSDDRKNGPLQPELVEWGNNDWNPRTIKAGWKYWANIVPQEVIAAGALVPVIENLYTYGLNMQVFTNKEDAIKWLDKFED